MLVLSASVLWLVVFGLLLLFAVAFILRRPLTIELPTAPPSWIRLQRPCSPSHGQTPPPRRAFSAQTLASDAWHAIWFATANHSGRPSRPFRMFQCMASR